MYLGDFPLSGTINFKFTTRNTNSVPATFTAAALTIYKDSGTVNTNSGVTLVTDFNGVTGLNNINVNLATNVGFYSTGSDFHIVALSGNVSGASVAGEFIESFSIRNRTNVLDLANGIETSYTLRDAVKLILAANSSILSGAGTNTVYIRDINNIKNRIVATVTPSGNRTAIVYDVT